MDASIISYKSLMYYYIFTTLGATALGEFAPQSSSFHTDRIGRPAHHALVGPRRLGDGVFGLALIDSSGKIERSVKGYIIYICVCFNC